MKCPVSAPLLLSLLVVAALPSVTFARVPTSADDQCGIWMAGSTLGDTTNLGMYAGKDIEPGVEVQQEIAIPLLFRNWDAPDYYETDDGELWDRYIWEGEVADLETYDNTDTIQSKAVFVPGIGCTINSILDGHNVESTHGSTYSTAGLHRSKDPGAGAFTPYHDTHTVSVEPIQAGQEIFAAYGDNWIPEIPGAQVTFHHNFEAAESFLRDDYYRFVNERDTKLTPQMKESLWNFTRDFPVTQNHIFSVLPRGVAWKEIETKLQEVMEADEAIIKRDDGNKDNEDDAEFEYDPNTMVVRQFIRQQARRDVDWLKQNGRCCDHIRPGKSNIPQAGRGAFASRDLPKGTVVGYSPLIHVALEGHNLYRIPYGSADPNYEPAVDDNGQPLPDDEQEEGYEILDLVVNYSFKHKDSTLMLTPYGSMVNYINHDSKNPNVRVQWPVEEMVAHKPEWLQPNMTLSKLRLTFDKIGLSFDYVALRDIQEGEEITMDYGPEWEEAWRQHVAKWEPVDEADDYVHSTEWPADEPLRTEDELEENPYPSNLETMCQENYYTDPATGQHVWVKPLRQYSDRVPCAVVERYDQVQRNGMPVYRVELFVGVDETSGEDIVVEVDQVPHNQIFLVDKVKSADWHMPNVFRHPIGIPDDIFPEHWKNLAGADGTNKGSAPVGVLTKMKMIPTPPRKHKHIHMNEEYDHEEL